MAEFVSAIPCVLSVLVCDTVIVHNDGKKTIVGIFDEMRAVTVPALRSVGFYGRLTDMEGAYKFVIRIVFLGDDGEELIGAVETAELSVSDRVGIVDLAVNLPPVPFPKYGRYEFQLFTGDMYLGRSTVSVVKMNEGGPV